MRKALFYVVIPAAIFMIPVQSFAQAGSKLSGTITDSSTKPLPFATVRLFKPANKQAVLQTTLSKEDGSFQMTVKDTGSYLLMLTHSGYVEKQQLISIKQGENIQLPAATLSKAPATLSEVVVRAQRPLVEQADDRVIFNVEDDPASKTETAIDLLRKAPFVTVDGEDNVKINGKSNFRVLLNGRETSMFARNIKEALRSFPGALISKIEVITSPSAKYDGEGIGGLINIVTKKKVVGYNGTLSSFSRTSDKLTDLSLNANAKLGKTGISILYDFGATAPVPQDNINTTIPTIPSAFSKRTLQGEQRNSSNWSFGNAEFSWEIDTLNALSIYANTDSRSGRTRSNQTITTDFITAPSVTGIYNLDNKTNNPGYSVGTDYIKKFKRNKEREFSLKLFGEFGRSNARISSLQDNPGTDRYLRNNSNAVNNQYTIQADHSMPVKKAGKLETGVKAILRRASSDFESLIKYDPAAEYKAVPSNTDNFKYAQDVLSVYGMYSFKIKKSSFRLGARAEYTNVDGNFTGSNTQVKNHYTTFLPNVQLTRKLSDPASLVISYNKRLSRPYIDDLNPFVFNNDSLNISYGNPDLGPQTIHSLSAQLRYSKGATFSSINLEGSYSGNKILSYSFFDALTGVTENTSLNIGKEFQGSLSVNFNTKFTSKWSMFVNGALRYSTVTNTSNKAQSNSGFGGNLNFSTRYKLTSKFSMSTYIGLWKDPVTIQTTYPFSTWYNLAFNYKVFNEKLNISLRTVNFFEKTRDYRTIVKDLNFYSTNVNRQIRRGAVLSLTYNFGKLTENISKKKGVTNDDLLTKPAPTTGN
jgi:hypothetical protein